MGALTAFAAPKPTALLQLETNEAPLLALSQGPWRDPMPAVRRARGLSQPFRLATLVMSAALLFIPRAALAADTHIKVLNAPGSLILDAPGKKTISFEIPAQGSAAGKTFVVTVYGYDSNASPMAAPVSLYRKTIAAPGGANVSVNVDVPQFGLFLVDAKVLSADGATLSSTKINVAAIASVKPNSFPRAGVITHFAQDKGSPPVVLPLIKKAGFTWIRDEIYWNAIEKQRGLFIFPPQYDRYIKQASLMDIKPLIVLDYANPAVYPGLFEGPQGFPRTAEERELFVNYVRAVTRRYGSVVKHWEVWNEPPFGSISYANYVALLKEVYVAIKTSSPDATVISCGGGGAGGGPSGDCITAILAAGGAGYQDGFSVHPYMSPYPPETGYGAKDSVIDSVNIPTVWPHLGKMMAANPKPGQGHFTVWVTEIGWPSAPASAGLSEVVQAGNIVRTYLLSRRYNAVEAVFWYDFVDDGAGSDDQEANFGLLRADLSPKTAYVATAVLAKTLGARSWDHAFIDSSDVKVFQYGTTDPVIVGWQAGTNAHPTLVKIPPGNYIQRDWQGITSTLIVPAQGLNWQLGPMPKYLTPAAGQER
jgi:hypothetical protein